MRKQKQIGDLENQLGGSEDMPEDSVVDLAAMEYAEEIDAAPLREVQWFGKM